LNCQETKELLEGKAVDALPDDESARVDEHLVQCPQCQAALAEIQADLSLLGQWSEQAPPSDLAAKTMARIRLESQPAANWWTRCWQGLDEALQRFGNHKPTPVTGLATTMVAGVLMISVMSPNLMRGRSSGAVIGCRSNLRVLGKGLDQYARAHQGHFPDHLGDLKGDFLQEIPNCPSAGEDTYSEGYEVSADHNHYTLSCHGSHHGLSDQPQITK
jgi:hypothetical protein